MLLLRRSRSSGKKKKRKGEKYTKGEKKSVLRLERLRLPPKKGKRKKKTKRRGGEFPLWPIKSRKRKKKKRKKKERGGETPSAIAPSKEGEK